MQNLLGGDALVRRCAHARDHGRRGARDPHAGARTFTGHFCIDDTLLYEQGVRDFEKYRVDPSLELAPDFFVPDSIPPPPGVSLGTRMR